MNKEKLKEILNNKDNWKVFEELANNNELKHLPNANLSRANLKDANMLFANVKNVNFKHKYFLEKYKEFFIKTKGEINND